MASASKKVWSIFYPMAPGVIGQELQTVRKPLRQRCLETIVVALAALLDVLEADNPGSSRKIRSSLCNRTSSQVGSIWVMQVLQVITRIPNIGHIEDEIRRELPLNP